MDKLQHYRRLFQYDAWANREVFAALKQSESLSRRALQFLAHIVAAEILWLERIKDEPQSFAVWPELTFEQCAAHLARVTNLWRELFDTLAPEGFLRAVAYTNTKGETFCTPVEDILLHVLMHAAYHRGQIATEVRGAGSIPAYTDFIHAARSGFID